METVFLGPRQTSLSRDEVLTVVSVPAPPPPFGAKEIGEGSTLPVLTAVGHAIANATGVWIKELPITPERILAALRNKT